jgi:hypothetical protein
LFAATNHGCCANHREDAGKWGSHGGHCTLTVEGWRQQSLKSELRRASIADISCGSQITVNRGGHVGCTTVEPKWLGRWPRTTGKNRFYIQEWIAHHSRKRTL